MAQMRTEGASHHDIQNQRGDAQKQSWRKRRTALIKGDTVTMLDSPCRRTRRGVHKGPEGHCGLTAVMPEIAAGNGHTTIDGEAQHSTFGDIVDALLDPVRTLEDPDRDSPDLSGLVWPDPDDDRPEV
ncbi:hypothetical protein E1212_23370 [Jiangella ureilytica]|uniref:Uncharacterized protein n=1 Tax=Jiangella ureilytica TaxID=2530374 RepID=A0A4R4RF09_9ACTN|nr:hypothetical protein [Jiangella ureilytica]TDC47796.1 hypothetical protein E1212_23370 [Jiangella ureilytica]